MLEAILTLFFIAVLFSSIIWLFGVSVKAVLTVVLFPVQIIDELISNRRGKLTTAMIAAITLFLYTILALIAS